MVEIKRIGTYRQLDRYKMNEDSKIGNVTYEDDRKIVVEFENYKECYLKKDDNFEIKRIR